MKPLATEFTQKGYSLKQLRREGDLAIFERRSPRGALGFEVIRVRQYPDYEIGQPPVLVPAHEAYPSDSAFGKHGWSMNTLDRAEEKFDELKNPTEKTKAAAYVPTGGTKGRKRSDFELELPTGEFTVKQLHEKYPDKSVPFIHLRLNELKEAGRVKFLRAVKIPGAKGKPANVYESVPLDELPPELEAAQTVSGAI